MSLPSCIFAFSTKNYDAMVRFFSDIGFEITDGKGTQLCPMFNSGRGSYVKRGDVEFHLEESTTDQTCAPFNLWILDYTEDEIFRAPDLGYPYTRQEGFNGTCHTLTSPDGGIVTF